jgi:RNA polymerase sigma-70 factor (ECF subfamily)
MISSHAVVASPTDTVAGAMTEAEFDAFYRRTSRPLWAYAARVTGNPSTADDIVQKAFFHFLRASLRSNDEATLRAFVFKIATNLMFDHFRDAKREQGSAAREASVEPREDIRHDVQKVFASLQPRERALLWMAHVEEAAHHEIASTLGVGVKSVKVLLFRARRKLAELLQSKGIGS